MAEKIPSPRLPHPSTMDVIPFTVVDARPSVREVAGVALITTTAACVCMAWCAALVLWVVQGIAAVVS